MQHGLNFKYSFIIQFFVYLNMFYLLIKKNITYLILLMLLMSSVNVLSQKENKLNVGNIFSKNDLDHDIKEKINILKYSDPNSAISFCLQALEDNIPLGPSPLTLYLYSTLGELYQKKNLPGLALSYLEDAMYEYILIRNNRIDFANSQPLQQPWLTINIGNIFFDQHQYEKSLNKYKLSEKLFLEIDSILPRVRGLSTTYNNIALVHIELGNYNLALNNINRALDLRKKYNFNFADIGHSFKSLCELYFIWNMPEKGNEFLFTTDSLNNLVQDQNNNKYKANDDLYFKFSSNYVGNCHEYKGDYLFNQESYLLALESYEKASTYYRDFTFQKVNLINKKANVFYMLSQYKNCLKYLEECIIISKEQNLQNQIEISLELKIKALSKLGMLNKMEESIEEILKSKDYTYSIQISQLLSGIEAKNEILIKKREIEYEKNLKFKIILFSIIVILILGFAASYFLSRKVYLDKQMIIANQNEKLAVSELEHKKRELAAISTNIVQENEQFSNILKDLKYHTSLLNLEKDRISFSPLINSIKRILSEKRKDDLYSDQFNAAYPGYLEYLTRTYTDLTTADLKLCTFLRMNLNTKEMADIMGLSVRSVESRRYRLRKKLKLSNEEDLVSNLISLKY